jgi:TolB-like protein/DNA-binding winged helix-turn-helix (wHTH) protein
LIPEENLNLEDRTRLIRFGFFEADLSSGELRRQGEKVKLQEQPFQVLAALLERPGEVVTRDELQKRLWPSDVTVDFDRGLNKAINRLREALGDNAENPRFIETLPQRGYRFLAVVDAPVAPPEPIPVPFLKRRGVLAIAGSLISVPLLTIAYRRLLPIPTRIESIAVLPLENLSGDSEQEYFSDGMTDALIGEIARIGSLRVISRTSIVQYKRSARASLPRIASELNVDAILEGTVTRAGHQVRITVQLIRASDDRHLWSEKYERNLADILSLQGEVAREVASQIQIRLTPQVQVLLARNLPVNPEAHDLFLKGNYFLYQGTNGIPKSIDFFRRAIALDPSHAGSYAGLAQALCFVAVFGVRPSAESYPQAKAAALKALELDESNAGAHAALAEVKQDYDRDWTGANAEFKRALQLNPSHLMARVWYAESLTRMRRYDEAIQESDRAIALDPISPISHVNRAMLFFRARRYDEAIRTSLLVLDLSPEQVNALWWLGVSYAGKRDFVQAATALQKAVSLNGGSLFRAYLGYVYGQAGEKTKALGILEELGALAKQRYVPPVDFALVYAGLGDSDSTFRWLEKAVQGREMRIELSAMYYDGFRSDPRFADLSRRIGFSQ